MKININLQEDAKLRKEVRDMIKGAVTSIVREEIKSIIFEVVGTQGGKITPLKIQELIEKEIKSEVYGAIHVNTWQKDWKKLDKNIKVEINSSLIQKEGLINEQIEKTVSAGVMEKIQTLVQEEVQKSVKSHIKNILGAV